MRHLREIAVPVGYGVARHLRNLVAMSLLGAGAALANPVTVAALGDSLTQGYGLPPEDGFVPQLEAWLRDQGAVAKVLNAGVSGDTTAGGLSRVEWALTPEVDAMIVALGGNDVLRGIDPKVSRDNLEGILSAADARDVDVLLIGLYAPGNYGAEYKAEFDAMYPELAQEYGTLYLPSFFDGLSADAEISDARATYMQPDGIHPNAEGVKKIVSAVGPAVLDLIARAEAGR